MENGAFFSRKMREPEALKTIALINDLIRRLEPLDGPAIKKFLQDEGIKAKLFWENNSYCNAFAALSWKKGSETFKRHLKKTLGLHRGF